MVYGLYSVLELGLPDVWQPSGVERINVIACAAPFPQKSAVFAPGAVAALGRIMAHVGESRQ